MGSQEKFLNEGQKTKRCEGWSSTWTFGDAPGQVRLLQEGGLDSMVLNGPSNPVTPSGFPFKRLIKQSAAHESQCWFQCAKG